MTGKVKWFSDTKGYGLLSRSDGPDVFVHISQIQDDGGKSLGEGDHVEFEIGPGRKEGTEQAMNVVRLSRGQG